jgi:hypothetical protein
MTPVSKLGSYPPGTMRPDRVVVLPPPINEYLRLEQRVERFPCQQLVQEQHERSCLHSRSVTVNAAR